MSASINSLQEGQNQTIQNVKTNELKHYNNLVGKIDNTAAIVLSKNDKFEKCFLFKKIENDIEEYLKEHIAQADILPQS